MIVPWQRLSPEALQGLLEEFITREGTDYGAMEVSLEDKVAQVRSQLHNKEVVIVFDPTMEATTLMTAQAYREAQSCREAQAMNQNANDEFGY